MTDAASARAARMFWTIAALLVLWPSILGWARVAPSELVRVPQSPLDRIGSSGDQ